MAHTVAPASLPSAPAADGSLAQTFLTALGSQDFEQLAACFQPDVRFRALVPPGVREGADRSEALGWLRRWFGDASDLNVLSATTGIVGDRLHIAYRFHLRKPAGWQVIEQQAYCTVEEGRIADMAIVCSGFCPAPPPADMR